MLSHRPERVVTVGYGVDTDTAVALGVVPVAVPRVSSTPSGFQPWTEAAFGGTRPEQFTVDGGVPFERIASFNPDLILAINDYKLDEHHATLAAIAPLLSYATGPNLDRWQDTTRRVGHALGRDDQAQQRITETERKISQVRDASPLPGKTFTVSSVSESGQIHTKSDPNDVLVSSLAQFGLQLSPRVLALPTSGTLGIATVSQENLDVIDADLTLVSYGSAVHRQAFEATALFGELNSVRRGGYVALDSVEAQALAFPSVLSINHTADHIVPRLAEALR
ncbi:ABC transporter substrate-binding protein [Goodfellowiella coeruleoviolacea]|uniref:ABC transporter substrate-binding protein n=1 Tax=Goodfellowiella coeruleoviolacea TaxID=334858 RepID=UPI0020A534B5|nr:ABC transporter substrate-binding protein [Goodfellowiella coeruleoviolacea]